MLKNKEIKHTISNVAVYIYKLWLADTKLEITKDIIIEDKLFFRDKYEVLIL